MSAAEPRTIAELVAEPLSPDELYAEAIALWEERSDRNLVDRTLEFYTNFYLQDDILMKVDRAAMMTSLETRAVFLDNDLVEFCSRLPSRFKYRHGQRKYLLKRALKGHLPNQILNRSKKGFGIPLAKWLRTIPEVVPADPLPGIDIEIMQRYWRDHRNGHSDHRLLLWSWLSLQYGLTNARVP